MTIPRLVLSLFPGVGSLDEGFRRAGFCVVTAGDVAWSSLFDVRNFHVPRGTFDGIIGGDPCQTHSALANLVRAKGLEPSFPDLTPEFCRVIEEAGPRWFLRENVPRAPEIKPQGYAVKSFLLDHSTMDSGDGTGYEQMRRRRFWFGVWGDSVPELRAHIDFAMIVLPDPALTVDCGHDKLDGAERIARRRQATSCDGRKGHREGRVQAVTADRRAAPVKLGGSGKLKSTCVGASGHKDPREHPDANHGYTQKRYTIDEMLDLQGLPRALFEYSPATMQGKRTLVGNAVPLPMAEALARAVQSALEARISRSEHR